MTRRRIDDAEMLRQRFGRLTVIWEAAPMVSSDRERRRWVCRCDCGAVVEAVHQQTLRNGQTRSCGCLARELAAARMWGSEVTADEILADETEQRNANSRLWESWFGRAADTADCRA